MAAEKSVLQRRLEPQRIRVLPVSEGSFEQRLEGTIDGKRALFAAAVGDDQETVELERSSMARRIATLHVRSLDPLAAEALAAATSADAGTRPERDVTPAAAASSRR